MKLVMTLLVRDEADIVDAQIAYHLGAGVDFVVATDNRSEDETTEILERYARDGVLHLIREPGDDLRQSEWVTRMARLAATDFGADWIVNADADEFWLARGATLKELFAAVPSRFGAVRGAWRNFVPRPDDERLRGFLAYVGFGGRGYIEATALCFSGKADQQVAAPSVSIGNDRTDPRTLGAAFDFEGVPRQRVDLMKDGVFKDAVYDLRTAKQVGRTSTGHGLPAPNPDGPFPLNLFMQEGDATLDDMIRSTERGLLITRFHYSNIVNPIESSITGMTRDGTFLIERGEIAGPVMNFRFTQSIIDALTNVSLVGRQAELASEFFFPSSRVPALKSRSSTSAAAATTEAAPRMRIERWSGSMTPIASPPPRRCSTRRSTTSRPGRSWPTTSTTC